MRFILPYLQPFISGLTLAIIALIPSLSITATQSMSQNGDHPLMKFFNHKGGKIFVDVGKQRLFYLTSSNHIQQTYSISTGRTGTGEQAGSGKTPRGLLMVDQKIGDGNHYLQAYIARQPINLHGKAKHQGKNILSRIMTLQGIEKHNQNTLSRYVYIHGTPAISKLGGKPVSEGCIRMDPKAIIELFNQVKTQTPVYVYDKNNPLPHQGQVTQVASRLTYDDEMVTFA